MLRYVLFDLDGTLTDSKEGILRSLRYAFERLGDPEPPPEVLIRFIGPSLLDSFQTWCGYSAEKAARGLALFRERYDKVGKFENAPAPGAADALERLRGAELTLALASAKPDSMCRDICGKFGFTPHLAAVVGSQSEHWDKARVITEALRILGVPDGERGACIMVGDRRYDVEGAAQCGLACLGVEFFGYAEPGELEAAGAAAVVHTVAEMEDWLLRAAKPYLLAAAQLICAAKS